MTHAKVMCGPGYIPSPAERNATRPSAAVLALADKAATLARQQNPGDPQRALGVIIDGVTAAAREKLKERNQ